MVVMANRRVGIWLIGVFGGVGSTVAMGLSAMSRGLASTTGLVTAGPGPSRRDLDAHAEKRIRAMGAVPSFKGYHGFPASICASSVGRLSRRRRCTVRLFSPISAVESQSPV